MDAYLVSLRRGCSTAENPLIQHIKYSSILCVSFFTSHVLKRVQDKKKGFSEPLARCILVHNWVIVLIFYSLVEISF